MRLKQTLFLLAIIVGFNACKKDEVEAVPEVIYTPQKPIVKPYVIDNSFKVVAYMPSYRDPATVTDAKFKMITHLFYAFLNINSSADGSLNPLPEAARFYEVQRRAKLHNVKFGISVMGASADFVKLAASATARTKFVTTVANFAVNNNLDGVDIDWEYPSTTPGIESADNYTLLMKELVAELHKVNKFVSAAVTPAVYVSGNRDAIRSELFTQIDFFNIMQYDGTGYDKDEPLNHASYKMSVASLDYWFGRGLPKERAVVGIPLYGKSTSGTGQTSKSFKDIEAAGGDVFSNLATVNGVSYGFNGITTVKQKAQLAKERANGIMFWEFAHDSNGANSLIKAANDQLGRAY